MRLTHFSLCSGIGGLDLAAECAGFETIGQCEIDNYASKVLAKNFKGVKNYGDIRTITNPLLATNGIEKGSVTVLSAGFPCQPYSLAGKGLGDGDERDMWGEVARVIGELNPRWFVGENTPGLFSRSNQKYFHRVLSDLSALGYSVSWGMWGACDVGAPHKRDRVFIIAYAASARKAKRNETSNITIRHSREIPNTTVQRFNKNEVQRGEFEKSLRQACKWRVQTCWSKPSGIRSRESNQIHHATSERYGLSSKEICTRRDGTKLSSWWQTEPDVGRVAHGISARVDRLRCLGNAVVPQQAYPVFKAIANQERMNDLPLMQTNLNRD